MADPSPSPDSLLSGLGIKLGTAIAGLSGSILALVRVRNATPREGLTAFLSGVGCAMFFTPAVSEHLGLGRSVEYALAFVFGVCGMIIIVGVVRLAEKFGTDPLGVISYLRRERATLPPGDETGELPRRSADDPR